MTEYLGRCAAALFLAGWSVSAPADPYLYVWSADQDERNSDFLAVLDADPGSDRYGEVLTTIEVGVAAHAHHTEHRVTRDTLFMNGFHTGHSFVMNLRDPAHPMLTAHFTDVGEYSHPHSFERLPSGNVLVTFQNALGGRMTTGGLVELDSSGVLVRTSSALVADLPDIRPYSLLALPERDRVITTSTDMWGEVLSSDAVQVWRLSDLTQVRTLRLPPGPRGDEQRLSAEPRLMDDGETVIVNTFTCGLYRIRDVATDRPRVEHIYTFDLSDISDPAKSCAVPVTTGRLWIQTVPSRNGLVALDLSNPDAPQEIGFVNLGSGRLPHWIAIDSERRHIVVTGYGELLNEVMMVTLDAASGRLAIDRAFGIDGVVDFRRTQWPHGANGPAVPHGSVFSMPLR